MEPPPSWWVLTYHNYTRSWNELYVCAFTNTADHLSMAWSYTKPTRHAIWRVVRGKDVFCGYKYIWDTPIIVHQNRPGDTYEHIWLLQNLESDRHIWYYLFAPLGPYGLEIQGPLIHVAPPEVHLWTSRMIVGTKLKGIFYTDSFSGPGGPPPVWQTINGGLHSLQILQLEPDPFGVEYRHYCIAAIGPDTTLYKRVPPDKPGWYPILTNSQAETLTGTTDGQLRWVKTNVNHPAHIFVLYYSATISTHAFLLRSLDYGATWSASEITSWAIRAWPVNLDIGISAGLSPYGPGAVFYCIQSSGAAFYETWIMRSFDYGYTWSLAARTGDHDEAPLVYVDPTDQSTLYTAGTEIGITHHLYRSTDHGATIQSVGGQDPFGPFIAPERGLLWINPADPRFLRVLQDNHVWTTPDAGASWQDWGSTQVNVARHTATWENPTRLYLAKHNSGTFPPVGPLNHVIFVSDTHGIYMEGKAGEHPYFEDGGGDSIPYNCGGLCHQGMMLYPPY